MGKAYSLMLRPFRTFNIMNRTERVISKEKPTPAPQYPYVQKQKEMVDKLYPNFMEEHSKKNTKLDDHLKRVFVVSEDSDIKAMDDEKLSTRLLPQDRHQPPVFEYGVYQPKVVSEGKFTLKQALEFLSKYNQNATENSVERIAQEYKLNKQVVENIVKYFKVPNVKSIEETKRQIAINWNPMKKN